LQRALDSSEEALVMAPAMIWARPSLCRIGSAKTQELLCGFSGLSGCQSAPYALKYGVKRRRGILYHYYYYYYYYYHY
jgi:hypothetical protein